MADWQPSDQQQKFLHDILRPSEQFALHFYRVDIPWCLNLCMPDVTYLDCRHDYLTEGTAELRHAMMNHVGSLHVSLAVAVSVKSRLLPGGASALVLTDHYLILDPAYGDIQTIRAHATLLWVMTATGPRLQHIQLSAPLLTLEKDASFESDRLLHLRIRDLIGRLSQQPPAILHDTNGTLWRLLSSEVRAIEAHRQHTILHCLERDIVVRRSFAETIRLFGDELLAVHRSYAVNPLHVRSVSHTSVTLDNGVCIPLPQRRARQVREQLERAMHESTPVLDSYELIETMGVRPDAQTAHGSVEDAAHT